MSKKLLILVILLLTFFICWSQIRPALIKSGCANYVSKINGGRMSISAYNFLYANCIHKKGL